jgi:glycosyltransferase involved in cell wall biosynthesis
MNIDYITTYDATDVHNWSGSGYFIAKALEDQDARIRYVGDLQAKPHLLLSLKSHLYRLNGKAFLPERESFVARQYASKVSSRIRPDTDIIFSPGTIPIALLQSNKPKVFYTDATFAGMIGFYDSFSGLAKETIEHGNYLEQKALDTSRLAIYASDWAARTAIDNYKIDPDKVKVVPFGANIESSRDFGAIREIVSKRSDRECHLLFMGVDWIRKRGDFAVEVARIMNKLGLKTTLHIAGIRDLPQDSLPDFVVNHGFISKSTRAGMEKINKLMSDCHFLLLPTKAECFGLVFCEAGSFGLPSIATNVGGIPSVIEDEINGKTFSLSMPELDYANYILFTFTNKLRYNELAYSSFDQYEKKLNWNVAGKAIMNLLKTL